MEKHFWVGTMLLIALLLLALGITWFMTAIHTPSAQALEQAAQAALQGDIPKAQAFANKAKVRWKRFRSLSAAVADHDPIEEADSLFAALDTYAAAGNTEEFAACCAQLNMRILAIIQAHSPAWWNLL